MGSWQPITLHLDAPGVPEWNPAVMRGDDVALRVGDWIVMPATATP